MKPVRPTPRELWRRVRGYLTVEAALTALTLLLIVVFNRDAAQDRLLLNLYYIGIAAAAYALVRRRAVAMMMFVVLVAAGTTLANVYFSAKGDPGDPFIDLTAWCALLLVSWRLALRVYRIESESRRLRIQREIDERALAMRVSALAATSHEVRTPLSGILSFAEMLKDESAGPLTELQKNFVDEINQCGQYLMTLVNDILDYSKAQAGQIKLSPETVALPELVDQCMAMIQPRATAAEIKLTWEIDPTVSEIVADPLRLKQMLLNLLSNAMKYSPTAGLVKLQVRTDETDILISVRDTGRGISAEQMEHLFDPYYQATHGDSRIGTGLGLAITKRLTEVHGGSISVESAPGAGSLFTIRLPASAPTRHQDDVQGSNQETWMTAIMSESKARRLSDSAA